MKFSRFKVGRVLNPIGTNIAKPELIYSSVTLICPYRLNAMALDPSLIDVNKSFVYSPGEIVFPIKLYRKIKIELRKDHKINIGKGCSRPQIAKHAVLLMKSALKVNSGFNIDVTEA